MEKNCLTCEYEPEWGKWVGGEYPRCFGKCKYIIELPILPSVYRLTIKKVERYSDDSGIETHCKAWKRKTKLIEKVE